MEQQAGTKIGILGFGREGKSLLKFLRSRGFSQISTQTDADIEIWILDKNQSLKIPRGARKQLGKPRKRKTVFFSLGKNYLRNLERFAIVFRSPGVPWNLPELVRARKNGVKFSSATKLFFEQLRGQTRKNVDGAPLVIGITGTKGKGTTATLLYKILKAHSTNSRQARKDVFLAGNIGKPTLDILPKIKKGSWVILELSSFQLQDLKRSPHIAVILDVFPDHQDAHLSLKEYYEAKTNIARYQKRDDEIFFFSAKGRSASGGENNARSHWVASKSRGKKIAVSPNHFRLFGPSDLKIPGFHNFKNAVMAATVAKSLGVPEKTILKVVKNFRGLPHRLELIKRLRINTDYNTDKHRSIRVNPRLDPRKSASIEFWNDSASTNPQTTAAAVLAFGAKSQESRVENSKNLAHDSNHIELILIAGGQDKGLDYKPLAQALRNSNTRLVVLFGENRRKIARAIKKSGMSIKFATTLSEAVKIAHRTAISDSRHSHIFADSHYVIIFSPGAASFDQFRDYADRGRQFKWLVQSL